MAKKTKKETVSIEGHPVPDLYEEFTDHIKSVLVENGNTKEAQSSVFMALTACVAEMTVVLGVPPEVADMYVKVFIPLFNAVHETSGSPDLEAFAAGLSSPPGSN